MEVFPSHLGGRRPDGGMFSNMSLRIGTVQAVYYPGDPKNVSKNSVEYKVFVDERSNGTANSRMYDHVVTMDSFGGVADTFQATYRPDSSASKTNSSRDPERGLGSRVLLLCINGESHSAVIIGGLKHGQAPADSKEDGHHLHFVFNGVSVDITDEGALSLALAGKTDVRGTPVQDDVGTKVEIATDGSVTITAKTIKHGGPGADEPLVLGNKFISLMSDLIQQIEQIVVANGAGETTPPFNVPAFELIKQQLQTLVSTFVYTQRDPG